MKVQKTSDCWNWTGCLVGRKNFQYGQIRESKANGGNRTNAHRVAYQLFVGAIPDGLCVLHKCDNPRCVRPDHLFLGTINDNNQDKKNKGRCVGLPGENHPGHKLTLNDVDAIRSSLASSSTLAEHYGVTHTLIKRIRSGKAWYRDREKLCPGIKIKDEDTK